MFSKRLDEIFCNILFFCRAQNIYNHRLCWPTGVFVVNSFLSYNYKNICVRDQGVQNVCAYASIARVLDKHPTAAYNLYGQQSR